MTHNEWELPRRPTPSPMLPMQAMPKLLWLLLQDLKTSQREYSKEEMEMADLAMVTHTPDGRFLVGPGMGS